MYGQVRMVAERVAASRSVRTGIGQDAGAGAPCPLRGGPARPAVRLFDHAEFPAGLPELSEKSSPQRTVPHGDDLETGGKGRRGEIILRKPAPAFFFLKKLPEIILHAPEIIFAFPIISLYINDG